jgi:predicted transcriptional regulator
MLSTLQQLSEVSTVLGSEKRTVLLYVLKSKPMSYMQINRGFKSLDMKIGSSEIYKHLDVLKQCKYIVKRGKVYLITLKGKTLIDSLEDLASVPEKAPRLEIVF